LNNGRARAVAEGLSIDFKTADAEALPFPDGAFDVVLSTFGVMFTPEQFTAAHEIARVCWSGGKTGMANWMSDGFIGQLFKTTGKHAPRAAGVKPPSLWGTEDRLEELFEGRGSIKSAGRVFTFRYCSPAHWVEVFALGMDLSPRLLLL
jgi:hypothetical protein